MNSPAQIDVAPTTLYIGIVRDHCRLCLLATFVPKTNSSAASTNPDWAGRSPGRVHPSSFARLARRTCRASGRLISSNRRPEWHGNLNSGQFALFDVFYEDGSQRSNRRVPLDALGGYDGDAPARTVIEEQDRLIAEKSGSPALAIKSISRSKGK